MIHDRYSTFSNIRVFDNGGKKTPYMLTDHVNFPNSILERYLDLRSSSETKKFFILCIAKTYNHYGVERWGLELVGLNSNAPIVRAPTIKNEWEKRD